MGKLRLVMAMGLIALSVLFGAPAIAGTELTDDMITAEVKAKIAADRSISAFDVDVHTEDGVVDLSGKVDSNAQAGALVELVQSVEGVNDVNTAKLSVKGSKHVLNDTLITSKVKGLFVKEKLFGDKDVASMTIHVETKNGTVYLTGSADNQTEVNNAIRLAKSVKDVKKVESRVHVN